ILGLGKEPGQSVFLSRSPLVKFVAVAPELAPMSAEMIILVLLIATALAFDFTNGFHDTGNAMATSIATGALKPKTAVLLAGGLIGAGLAALAASGLNWTGITSKVIIPAVAAPVIACLVAACGTWLVYRITRNVMAKRREEGFRWGQIATASLVALSHGTNDAQKTMGVIALALITTGHLA